MTTQEIPPLTVPEAEEYVVGCLMVADYCMTEACARLTRADFTVPGLPEIFGVMVDLYRGGLPYSLPAAADALRAKGTLEAVGGTLRLADLAASGYLPAHFTNYAVMVCDAANLRRLEAAMKVCTTNAYSVRVSDHADVCQHLTTSLDTMRTLVDRATASMEGKTAADVLDAARIEAGKPKDARPVLRFGLNDLDAYGPMLGRGRLVVIGAKPGCGKSTMLLHVAIEAVKQGLSPFLVSLEMPEREIADRLTSHEVGRAMPDGGFTPEQYGYAGQDEMYRRMHISTKPGMRIAELRALALDAKRRGNCDVLLVDYVQLIVGPKSDNRQHELSIVVKVLKALAMDLDIPIVTGAQLNRGVDEFSEPGLDHLRESGEIGQSADVVMLMWSTERGSNRLQVKVAKNRAGENGLLELEWDRAQFKLRTASILGEDLMAAEARGWKR